MKVIINFFITYSDNKNSIEISQPGMLCGKQNNCNCVVTKTFNEKPENIPIPSKFICHYLWKASLYY